MPPAPPVALPALLAALVAASAGIADEPFDAMTSISSRHIKSLAPDPGLLGAGCLFEGRWHAAGDVPTGEACLQCSCRRGALVCRRRACAPLPDSPPRRCHVLHRKGACCPELHCPDGVTLMEQGASARYENADDIDGPVAAAHACVEGGTIYAAGSAMRSEVACEQCFCLGGARHCIRPRCLPPPSGCRARAAPGACCPQRYYCDHTTTTPPLNKHPHDCKIDDKWIAEGERVASPNCSQCFCLRGAVQCQPLSCAPPLLGCRPLLRPGECCAHQYHCDHSQQASHVLTLSNNALTPARSDDRAFHSNLKKQETTTKNTLANIFTAKNTPTLTAKSHLVSTTKVKRKTSDPPPPSPSDRSSQAPVRNITVAPSTITTTLEPPTPTKLTTPTASTSLPTSTPELATEVTSTEQPEGSVRIMVNGTINCTAELSSTSLPLNVTYNEVEQITSDSHPRIPLIDVSNLEDHTVSANDIITDRTVNGGFDENESFVINVTSSLTTNTSRTTMKPLASTVSKISIPTEIVETNSSKKTKGDYDYDYTEPTLPPSLPNLKIIPFVAADAVLEDDHSKETYPILEREDKFPIYYPSGDAKDSAYVTRREDVYRSTQYPVFITDKPKRDQIFQSLTPDVDVTNTRYSDIHADLDNPVNDFTVSTSLGNRATDVKPVTQRPSTTAAFTVETPAVNLFSPPIETEGGFLPKGPTGLIEEYFAVFPSTPPGPAVPHLTTSMQLDITKEECVSSDGRHVREGESIVLACSDCTCAWGELLCSPRACATPTGCQRRPTTTNAADLCCGELICDEDNKTTAAPDVSTIKVETTKTTELISSTASTTNLDSEPDYRPSPPNSSVPIDPSSKNKEEQSLNSVNSTKTETTEATTRLSTTERSTTTVAMTTAAPAQEATTPSQNQSLEYDEEEEDEGFSFGSVLKLLLSENYGTTTIPPKRTTTTTKAPPPTKISTTTRRPRPSLPPIQPPKPAMAPFVPLPIQPYIPSKKNQNPINRIDHLVLGEATAIKSTTSRVATTTFWPVPTTGRPTTPPVAIKPTEITKEDAFSAVDGPRPPAAPSGLGLLKLAGCNIYGRMYRVGRIIAELSTPCQQCWCTEFGVQCKQLKC